MKFLFLFLLIGHLSAYAVDEIYRGNLKPPVSILSETYLNKALFSDTVLQHRELKKVKYFLLNGEASKAEVILKKLSYDRTKLRPILYRYSALVHFIQGDFDKSYRFLTRPVLNQIPHYSKICLLKVLNQIVLNKTNKLEEEWTRCQIENTKALNPIAFPWLDILVKLKIAPLKSILIKPFKGVRLSSLTDEEIKILLKLSIYLNQEKLLVNQIPDLTSDQLQDPEVRELIGHLFYNLGSFAKSYRFIEDLNSPNAENIKGNLYILRNKYELAYAQFKLALELKQNSQNAMERLLPLSWLLNDWSAGATYAERVIASPQTQINKLTLLAAFLTQKGEFDKAKEVIKYITDHSQRGTEIDVTQIMSFVALMQNDPALNQKYALMSCAQYDLVNCWLLFQLSQWEAFPITIRRSDKVSVKKNWETFLKEDVIEPLEETVFINQLDIEEMDDKLLQIVPDAK